MKKESKIYIAGHNGMVGSAILRQLEKSGYSNLIFSDSSMLDLTHQDEVQKFFHKEKPEYVFLAAAKVGGIMANNTFRAQFIYENLMIQNNIIHSSWLAGVKRLLFLGSSCIYPRLAPQPLKEDYLLTSELEYTNEPYAIAKIAGIKMIESYNIQYNTDYLAVMPTNLYGPNDNYDLQKSHVLPAMIRKIYLAKCLENNDWPGIRKDLSKRPIENISGSVSEENTLSLLQKYGIYAVNNDSQIAIHKSQITNLKSVVLKLWGSGSPLREFMHVDDLASACVHIMEKVSFKDLVHSQHPTSAVPTQNSKILNTHINLGTGSELSISDLAKMIKGIVGFNGNIEWDSSKPDGTPRKLMDVSKMKSLGFVPTIPLHDGISRTYHEYLDSL